MNKKCELLFSLIEKGNFEKVYFLLSEGCNVNYQDDQGITPLMYAITFEQYDIAELLLSYGADPNVQDYNGYSSLTIAAYFGNIHAIKLLITHGANPFIQDFEGNSMLSVVLLHNHPEVGRSFIKCVMHFLYCRSSVERVS